MWLTPPLWLAGHRTDASQGHNWVSFKNPPAWGCTCFLKHENMDTHQYRCLGPKVCLVKGLKCAKTLYIYMYNATAKTLITLMSTWQLHIDVLSQHVFMFDFITANVRSTPSGFTVKIYKFAGLNILTLLFPVYTCFIPSKHEQSFPALWNSFLSFFWWCYKWYFGTHCSYFALLLAKGLMLIWHETPPTRSLRQRQGSGVTQCSESAP